MQPQCAPDIGDTEAISIFDKSFDCFFSNTYALNLIIVNSKGIDWIGFSPIKYIQLGLFEIGSFGKSALEKDDSLKKRRQQFKWNIHTLRKWFPY